MKHLSPSDVLPSAKSPTISELASGGFAVESVVDKRTINTLIPSLKDAGASEGDPLASRERQERLRNTSPTATTQDSVQRLPSSGSPSPDDAVTFECRVGPPVQPGVSLCPHHFVDS